MRRVLVGVVLVAGALAGCGDDLLPDGEPLAAAPNLTIVAHQDDDLLFMQPDVGDLADRRAGLTSVYITAGARDGDLETSARRNAGLMEAYAEAAGLESRWACGWIDLAGHAAEHCRLAGARVSLVFLGYPDGGRRGERADSLLHLWQGTIAGAETLARRTARYDQDGLIAAVAAVIVATGPTTIRTLEVAASHGRDHADHMIVGALATLAAARAGYAHELLAFRGYATESEPTNVVGAAYDRAYNMLAHYHACASGCASCGSACPEINIPHATWAARRYAIARRTGELHGRLRLDDRCAHVDAGGGLVLGDCATAPAWELAASGALRTGERCASATAGGALAVGACEGLTAGARFFLDDEGHLWSGQPPDPARVVLGAHASCVGADGDRKPVEGRARSTPGGSAEVDRLGVAPCGGSAAPSWRLVGYEATTAPRPAWLATATGRAVRLGPWGLCAVAAGELACAAPVAGPGGLDEPMVHGALAIEPASLVFVTEGDRASACGRSAAGLVCLAPGEPARLWSPSFADDGPATATDRSLGGFEGEICGLDAQGVTCTRRGLSIVPDVRSRWPAPDSALWPADLDGDGTIDWCVGTPTGAWCARAADRLLSTNGTPWTYHLAGAPAPSPAQVALGALVDVDGDGRADLCTVHERHLACARSQRYGFGPLVPLAELPAGAPPRALWMDGASACVDDDATITCVAPR